MGLKALLISATFVISLHADAYITPSNGLLPEEQKAQGSIKPKTLPQTPNVNSSSSIPSMNTNSSGQY